MTEFGSGQQPIHEQHNVQLPPDIVRPPLLIGPSVAEMSTQQTTHPQPESSISESRSRNTPHAATQAAGRGALGGFGFGVGDFAASLGAGIRDMGARLPRVRRPILPPTTRSTVRERDEDSQIRAKIQAAQAATDEALADIAKGRPDDPHEVQRRTQLNRYKDPSKAEQVYKTFNMIERWKEADRQQSPEGEARADKVYVARYVNAKKIREGDPKAMERATIATIHYNVYTKRLPNFHRVES